jgi:uncharacterized protein (TIGR02118 family)
MIAIGATGLLAMIQSGRLAALAQEASPVAPAAPTGPIKLVALYNTPDDPAAFDDYYLNKHLPLFRQVPNYQRLELARVIATADGSPSPFYRVTEAVFADMATFQASLATPEAQAAVADVVNFASAGATMLITEIDVLEVVEPVATPQP